MAKKKSRPVPITKKIINKTSSKEVSSIQKKPSQKNTQYIISTYHTLNKQLEDAKKNQNALLVKDIESEIEKLGGLDAYQHASATAGGEKQGKASCSKWLIQKLTDIRKNYKLNKDNESTSNFNSEIIKNISSIKKIRILDVGALDGYSYERYKKWIDPVYIDINPQSTNVIKQDFFDMKIPNEEYLDNVIEEDTNINNKTKGHFNVIALSLVVNFVGDIYSRGLMLYKAQKFLPKTGGYVYLVLPLPCINNSRYFNEELLIEITKEMGYKIVDKNSSPKLVFYLFEFIPTINNNKNNKPLNRFPKRIVNDGSNRNNFCIAFDLSKDI